MVSFAMGWVIRTEQNYSTWFSGSPNYLRDDVEALSATVPTFWWPDEILMNWKIHKIGVPVTFKAGDPFCFFNVYDNTVMPNVNVSVSSLWDDKELVEQRMKYGDFKAQLNIEKPWTWAKGIKTGLDVDGNVIGPTFTGLPVISVPNQ